MELASTLIPDAYTSPEFFALEQETVFATSWVAVGFTSDVDRARRLRRRRGRRPVDHRHPQPARRAARRSTTSAATAPRSCSTPTPARSARAGASAARTTTGPTTPTARAWARRCSRAPTSPPARSRSSTRRWRRASTAPTTACSPSPSSRGASSSSSTSPPDPAPLATQLGDLPQRFADYRLDEWVPQRPQHLRRRRELQARRRELHGVLPPALGAPRAQPGLQVLRPLPLAGPRHVHGHVHHAGVAQHRRRRLGRARGR